MQKTDEVNAAGFDQNKKANGNTVAEACCAPSCCGTETKAKESKSAEEIKRSVNEKYSKIALASEGGSCCGTSCCESDAGDYNIMNDEYQSLDGYVPDADMGLGCGLPTEYAGIKAGDTVVDLGSGAGNDVYVARKIAGDKGSVIGVDMSEAMIAKANAIKAKYGFTNVEFRLGDIENLPVEDNTADVVVSNCVLNLV
ncbi:MAG: methyltransferase domain-containing protein, partial [Ignavibacteriales bacterium]|nr:methyltransferase domain-containing protein [Ignavibacteriales bacterium]